MSFGLEENTRAGVRTLEVAVAVLIEVLKEGGRQT